MQNWPAAHALPSSPHAVCPGHVSSIFPIACADEKRSATAQMIVFMLAGLRGNWLSGGAGASARARRALGVYYYVTSRRGARGPCHRIPIAATSQFSLSESRPRGPCGGCPPRATSSPRRVAAGRFMLAQTIVTLFAPARRRAPSTLAPAVLEGMQSVTHALGVSIRVQTPAYERFQCFRCSTLERRHIRAQAPREKAIELPPKHDL